MVTTTRPNTRLTLRAETARDLMTENPISLRHDAAVREAVALMTDRGITAAPVIDDNGRPIGVLSITDILVHDRESAWHLKTDDPTAMGDLRRHGHSLPADFGIEVVDPATVEDLMTPAVFCVPLDATAAEVVNLMVKHQVHHTFVADREGTLVGVISTGDILRHLG